MTGDNHNPGSASSDVPRDTLAALPPAPVYSPLPIHPEPIDAIPRIQAWIDDVFFKHLEQRTMLERVYGIRWEMSLDWNEDMTGLVTTFTPVQTPPT